LEIFDFFVQRAVIFALARSEVGGQAPNICAHFVKNTADFSKWRSKSLILRAEALEPLQPAEHVAVNGFGEGLDVRVAAPRATPRLE